MADMTDMYMTDGICCNLCSHFETEECVVKNASPWSRHLQFCAIFRHKESDRTIKEVLKNKIK